MVFAVTAAGGAAAAVYNDDKDDDDKKDDDSTNCIAFEISLMRMEYRKQPLKKPRLQKECRKITARQKEKRIRNRYMVHLTENRFENPVDEILYGHFQRHEYPANVNAS